MLTKIYIAIILILITGSFLVGYKAGSSKIIYGKVIAEETRKEIHEVIKYVDRSNSQEVDTALNTPIIINRNYSDYIDGCIIANISANDSYKNTTAQDRIRINIDTAYSSDLIIGYGLYLANKLVYAAPEVSYMRRFNKFSFGCGITFNMWDTNKIYGFRVCSKYQF
jgi:hypothetical protein